MRPNDTRRRLAGGQPALGLFISSASPLTAEIVGQLGVDWALVDLQHGENNLGNLSTMLQAVSTTPATPFVRVPANDATLIQRTLDLGAYGIVVPLVNTAEEAEAAVRAAKYPPRGERSWGPIRGALYGGPDYFSAADAETMLFVMLETATAVANAEAILATPGVDGCLVGTNDLRISYGDAPEVGSGEHLAGPAEAAVATILAACQTTGTIPGIQLYGADAAAARIAQGFRFIGLGTELRLMRAAATALITASRQISP
jgi:4-hydroxy-2-oxoheptanedioate aldolase